MENERGDMEVCTTEKAICMSTDTEFFCESCALPWADSIEQNQFPSEAKKQLQWAVSLVEKSDKFQNFEVIAWSYCFCDMSRSIMRASMICVRRFLCCVFLLTILFRSKLVWFVCVPW